MNYPTVSLVISTYNWPEALELIFLSLLRQTHYPNEIVIADDGSTEATKALIDSFRNQFNIPIHHIWQEDDGNRKAIIMNKAIAKATSDYIIEIDGDIIMHKEFIKDHLTMAEPNVFLYGSRANIKKEHLPILFKKKQVCFHVYSKGINKRGRLLRIPILAKNFKKENKRSSKFRGCNVSFWRSDFIAVNGYNESFKGWGMEDSELIERFINTGIQGKRLKYRGLVYHIYHKEQSRGNVEKNSGIEKDTIANKITYTEKGIDQYL